MLRKRGRSEHWKDLGQKGRMALTVSVKMSLSHRVHISPFSRPSMNTSIFCHNSDFPTKQLNRSLTWSVPKLVLLVFSTSDWQQGLSRLYFSPHPLLPPQTFPRVISAQLFPFRAQPNLFRGLSRTNFDNLSPFWQLEWVKSVQINFPTSRKLVGDRLTKDKLVQTKLGITFPPQLVSCPPGMSSNRNWHHHYL